MAGVAGISAGLQALVRLLPDVEFACDHVVVLHKGAVAAQAGNPKASRAAGRALGGTRPGWST